MSHFKIKTALIIFSVLLVNNFKCVLNAPVIIEDERGNSTDNPLSATIPNDLNEADEDRVEISYNPIDFKEIDHDVLQVIGDPSKISLSCHSVRNNVSLVKWMYHGLEEYPVDHLNFKRAVDLDYREMSIDLSNGPPVARMECVLKANTTVRNNTLIYTGDDSSPYLFNNQKTARATVINETIAVLPCLLNYPVENTDDKALELLKNGKVVENKNNCLHYVPELGFFLNLTQLEPDQRLGIYQCKVLNSTDDDYIFVELNEGNFIHVKYRGIRSFFYEKYPAKETFECSAPKSMFNGTFRWYYGFENGSVVEFKPERKPIKDEDPQRYPPTVFVDTILVGFETKDITHLVCASQTDSGKYFNSSLGVDVNESYPPEILNDPDAKPVIYTTGKNITCAADGEPVDFRWFKDGKPVMGLNTTEYQTVDWKRSTLTLNPHADDLDSNYTCEAWNFLGTAKYNFRVQIPPDTETRTSWPLVTILAVILAVITLLLGAVLTFYRVSFERRRYSSEKIKEFFEGHSSADADNHYDSAPFDRSKDIDQNNLIFDKTKELKGGNFGLVQFGWLKKNESKIPVAIKTIRDNRSLTKQQMDYAFQNFLREMKLMQHLGYHPNVLQCVGTFTSNLEQYCAFLILEYCNNGDLHQYLQSINHSSFHDDLCGKHSNSNGSDFKLKTSHLMKWAQEIASGMDHISKKNIIHMDLAARNILLHYDGYMQEGYEPHPGLLTAKICDFGLSKDLLLNEQRKNYYQIVVPENPEEKGRTLLPLNWVSPEALQTLKFTVENDIWSYGILCWEMFTLGESPYYKVLGQPDRTQLLNFLQNGNRLNEPEFAPPEMWELMLKCWSENPSERPSFATITEVLHAINENWKNQTHCEREPPRPVNYSSLQIVHYNSNNDDEDEENYEIEDDEAVQGG